ncbi:MAG: prenyltransferase [Syntrophomonadaceae bacterium]
MTELIIRAIPQQFKALYTLSRVLPVLSWGITSSLVGLGCAHAVNNTIHWLDYGLIVMFIIVVHGILSHAINDREDWLSGTDQLSPGILSGGSGVILKRQYTLAELSFVGKSALGTACIIAIYLIGSAGLLVMPFLALAVWSALAYSCPPLRLSYHPLAGEWLCGFPAVWGCAVGTFYVLTHHINGMVVIAGAIHALLAIGLLMHHHLSDISSDLQSTPRKLTSVALVGVTFGMPKTIWVESVYFLLALLLAVIGVWFFHPVFWITILTSAGCLKAALTTVPEDISSITNREYFLYALIIGDAVIKMAVLSFGPVLGWPP